MTFTKTSRPITRLLQQAALLGMVFGLTACASLQETTQDFISPKPACKNSLEANLQAVSLQPIMDGMTRELMGNACGVGTPGGFVVTDLVSMADLKPGVAGLVMGEVTRSSLTRLNCQRVFQVEATNLLTLNDKGFIALSRSATEVRPEIGPVREAVVGSYHAWPDKVLLVLRRINTQTGELTQSVSREISFGCKAR
ncbi:MAG: hypothetical protein ACO21C_02575 [Burkholderiaceae bacterium]